MPGGNRIEYNGPAFSLAGDKGRFVLPPAFRKTVAQSSDGRILCLAKHAKWDCLEGFGLSHKDELRTRLDREEDIAIERGLDFDRDERAMQLFSFVEIPFDASGRFVMPDYLVDLGGIDGELFFHGAGSTFTIWNPKELEALGPAFDRFKASCASMRKQVMGKKK